MQGRNGIETGKEIWNQNRKIKIIYISNLIQYKEVAQNHIHAFAYLVKPIKKENLFVQLKDVFLDIDRGEEEENIYLDTLYKGVIKLNLGIYFDFIKSENSKAIEYRPYEEFRQQTFNLNVENIDIEPNEVYASVVDMQINEKLASLICLYNGVVILYFATGSHAMDIGEKYNEIRMAAQSFLKNAKQKTPYFTNTTQFSISKD